MTVPNRAHPVVAQNDVPAKSTHTNIRSAVCFVIGARNAENGVKAYTINLGFSICNISPWMNPNGCTSLSVNA